MQRGNFILEAISAALAKKDLAGNA